MNLDLWLLIFAALQKEYSIGATINLPHAADQQYTVTDTPIIAISISRNIRKDQSGYKTSFVTIQYVKKS